MQLIQLLIGDLLILDVGAARIISSSLPTVETKYPMAQNLWPRNLRALRSTFCATQIELFPLSDHLCRRVLWWDRHQNVVAWFRWL